MESLTIKIKLDFIELHYCTFYFEVTMSPEFDED